MVHCDSALTFRHALPIAATQSQSIMIQESVVAIVPEDILGDVLPAVHRAGLGHLSRLLRAERSPLLDQLRRAGVPVAQAPVRLADCQAALLVSAAARSGTTGSLLVQHGAIHVWIVTALGEWIRVEDVVLSNPNVHLLPPPPAQRVPGRDPRHSVVRPATVEPLADQAD
jgi:hypothetical protein